ncbi:MAG: STAS domain-containing protein [Acidobacteria bacterium]|nr:STAS domain-containing protein [Acidobacteriota bacterium]
MNDQRLELSSELMAGGVGLVAAAGYINNEGGQAIADVINRLLDRGAVALLIDLEGTRIINSIGVSILLEVLEKLMEKNGRLAFCNLTPTIARTFEIMGLAEYASIFDDRETAIEELTRLNRAD